MVTKTSTDNYSVKNFSYRVIQNAAGSVTESVSNSELKTSLCVSSRTGDRNPSYRWQIENGLNATTDLTAVKRSTRFSPAWYHMARVEPNFGYNNSRFIYDSYYCPLAVVAGAPPSTTKASNQAAIRFYRKAWKELRAFQGGVFIGELLETIRMIKHPTKSFRGGINDFISAVKKRTKGLKISNPRKRKRGISNIVGDTWLEFAFGWQPLIDDIADASEAFLRLSEQTPSFTMVRAGSDDDVTHSAPTYTTVNINTYGGITGREEFFTTSKATCKFYGVVVLPTDFVPQPAHQLFGFTAADFLPTAWELVPWSFLIDYFTNIGDLIEACSFPSANLRWTSRTIRTETKSITKAYASRDMQDSSIRSTIYAFSSGMATTETTRTDVTRTANVVGGPNVTFQWELPGSGSKKWLNIAALAAARKSPPK